LQDTLTDQEEISKEMEYTIHSTIKKVSEDIDNCKFNTAIAALMSAVNEMQKAGKISRGDFRTLIILLNPFAPHITEELWEICGFAPKFSQASWPKYDQAKLVKDEVEIVIQINSKIRARVNIPSSATQEDAVDLALAKPELGITKDRIVKVIYIKGRLLNIIVK
jgi:leucyl-tRNA synthetase